MTTVTPSPAAPSLGRRLARLAPYFGGSGWLWVVAGLTTVLGAATEPAIPYLLKRLVDDGFRDNGLTLWVVPAVLISLFTVRGLRDRKSVV